VIQRCTGGGVRKDYAFTQAGKKLDVADQDQVIDRAGIGYHQPHDYCPRLFSAARSCSKSAIV